MSIAGCAFAMYWNPAWFTSVFTMKRLYVPLPIRVRVTPLAGVAHTLSTYPLIAKTISAAHVAAVFKTLPFIFDLRILERAYSLREVNLVQWRSNELRLKFS